MYNVLSTDNKRGLAGELYVLLADVYTASFRAQACHWNVRGQDFHQFHDFFAMIYGDIYASGDAIAENIRKLGFDAPMNLIDMCHTTMIREATFSGDPVEMTAALDTANDVIITRLFSVFAVANDINEQAIANYAAERLDKHQKWSWQMKATLGVDSSTGGRSPLGGGKVRQDNSIGAIFIEE